MNKIFKVGIERETKKQQQKPIKKTKKKTATWDGVHGNLLKPVE